MTTLVTDVVISQTTRNARSDLFSFRSSYGDLANQNGGKVALLATQAKTIAATKLLCMYFPKPTVIQVTINTVVTTMTVSGTLMLPVACSVTVTNTSLTTTDPLTFTYLVA